MLIMMMASSCKDAKHQNSSENVSEKKTDIKKEKK